MIVEVLCHESWTKGPGWVHPTACYPHLEEGGRGREREREERERVREGKRDTVKQRESENLCSNYSTGLSSKLNVKNKKM